MRVVLEAVEDTTARFIPDDGTAPVYIRTDHLPKGYKLGAVYEYQLLEGIPHLTMLEEETRERRERIKSKREALLSRSRKNKKRTQK